MGQRLIDANELRKNLSSRYMNELYPDWCTLPELTKMRIEMLAKEFRFALDHAPTIDAVEVVRCRECKHSDSVTTPEGKVYCVALDEYFPADGFCHKGEKMDGGAENGR